MAERNVSGGVFCLFLGSFENLPASRVTCIPVYNAAKLLIWVHLEFCLWRGFVLLHYFCVMVSLFQGLLRIICHHDCYKRCLRLFDITVGKNNLKNNYVNTQVHRKLVNHQRKPRRELYSRIVATGYIQYCSSKKTIK